MIEQLSDKPELKRSELAFERPAPGELRLALKGNWTLEQELPQAAETEEQLASGSGVRRLSFDSTDLGDWDSGLLVYLTDLEAIGRKLHLEVDRQGLPEGVCKLLALAAVVPERKGARRHAEKSSLLERIGSAAVGAYHELLELLAFTGETSLAFVRLISGKASFPRADFLLFLQQCGADALPIVTLISALFGLILAFVGAVQLLMFGAQLYVANLVAIAVVRVMGAVMCGVIMAGRTGAAFAAQLGTMQVNEEIDALKTLGISPVEFLVLPRMLALVLMMPLLVIYADLMGILGGLVVGVGMLDITLLQYLNQTKAALQLNHFAVGLVHAVVFGVLVAMAGCVRGIQCGRSASAVGNAATSAVVSAIVAIVVATAVITYVCNVLKV